MNVKTMIRCLQVKEEKINHSACFILHLGRVPEFLFDWGQERAENLTEVCVAGLTFEAETVCETEDG